MSIFKLIEGGADTTSFCKKGILIYLDVLLFEPVVLPPIDLLQTLQRSVHTTI